MFAVTGSLKEYIEEIEEEPKEIVFFLIEVMAASDDSGWELFWYNDGSDTGSVLFNAWGPSGEVVYSYPTPFGDQNDCSDIWSETEAELISEGEYTVIESTNGVRYRYIHDGWEGPLDLKDMTSLGTVTKNKGTARLLRALDNPNFETSSEYF